MLRSLITQLEIHWGQIEINAQVKTVTKIAQLPLNLCMVVPSWNASHECQYLDAVLDAKVKFKIFFKKNRDISVFTPSSLCDVAIFFFFFFEYEFQLHLCVSNPIEPWMQSQKDPSTIWWHLSTHTSTTTEHTTPVSDSTKMVQDEFCDNSQKLRDAELSVVPVWVVTKTRQEAIFFLWTWIWKRCHPLWHSSWLGAAVAGSNLAARLFFSLKVSLCLISRVLLHIKKNKKKKGQKSKKNHHTSSRMAFIWAGVRSVCFPVVSSDVCADVPVAGNKGCATGDGAAACITQRNTVWDKENLWTLHTTVDSQTVLDCWSSSVQCRYWRQASSTNEYLSLPG